VGLGEGDVPGCCFVLFIGCGPVGLVGEVLVVEGGGDVLLVEVFGEHLEDYLGFCLGLVVDVVLEVLCVVVGVHFVLILWRSFRGMWRSFCFIVSLWVVRRRWYLFLW